MVELTGKVIAVLPLASGVSNRTGNEWVSQEYVIEEQNARFPQRTCFRVFGREKIQQFALQLGDLVSVKLDLGCHEYNGKWYNEIDCWGVERAQAVQPQMPQQPSYQPQPLQPQNYAPAGQWQQASPQPSTICDEQGDSQQGYSPQPQPQCPPQGAGNPQVMQQYGNGDLPF